MSEKCTCESCIEIGSYLTPIIDKQGTLFKTELCPSCLTVKVKKYTVQYESELSFS